jgi:hypothetical protein
MTGWRRGWTVVAAFADMGHVFVDELFGLSAQFFIAEHAILHELRLVAERVFHKLVWKGSKDEKLEQKKLRFL